jgi:hypothetical protein
MAEIFDVQVLRQGPSKANPFTIVIVSNPVLKLMTGGLVADPIIANRPAFDAAVRQIDDCLFGLLPGQAERLLSDPAVVGGVRVVALFVSGSVIVDANCLVSEEAFGQLIAPRQDKFKPFLRRFNFGQEIDIAFAVSASSRFTRESARPMIDDNSRPGSPFTLDGVGLQHRHYNDMPGVVAMHQNSTSVTALHEFGHALSSTTNGLVTDLYIPHSSPEVNVRVGRPIPLTFGTLNGATFLSDPNRDGLTYPGHWTSYHCELLDPTVPAVMDNYPQAGNPLQCRHDAITRRFLLDRMVAKINR